MSTKGIILAANVTATTPGVYWSGGKAALVITALTYGGTSNNLQLQGPNGTWINMNGTTISADQVTTFDCPAGQYRIFISGTAAAALYANLVSVSNS